MEAVLILVSFVVLVVVLAALILNPLVLFVLLPFLGLLYAVYFYLKNRDKEEELETNLKKKNSGNY